MMTTTALQFDEIIAQCRELFQKKQTDYGASFRILRTLSVIDQILIKVKSVRNYQITGVSKVGESEEENFVAIVNYSVIGLIQITKGVADDFDGTREEMMMLYDRFTAEAKALMERKNHDYGEAWRDMEIPSITDMIYQKILRMKMILRNREVTLASEGLDANFYDMLNYSVFCLIKLTEQKETPPIQFI